MSNHIEGIEFIFVLQKLFKRVSFDFWIISRKNFQKNILMNVGDIDGVAARGGDGDKAAEEIIEELR